MQSKYEYILSEEHNKEGEDYHEDFEESEDSVGEGSLSPLLLQEFDIQVTDVDLMTEDEDFMWKGQTALDVRSCQFRHPPGFRPEDVVQLEPPSAVTSLAINTDWGLLAAGNSQGWLVSLLKYFHDFSSNMNP